MKKMTVEQQNLVLENEKLVHYTINRYFRMFAEIYDYEDLHSIGILALCDASILYNADKGVKFSTYAVSAIYRNIEKKISKRRYGVFRKLENNTECKIHTLDKPLKEGENATLKDMLVDNTIDNTEVETKVLIQQFIDKINNVQDKVIFKCSIANKPVQYIIKELKNNRVALGRQSIYNRRYALMDAFRDYVRGLKYDFKYPARQSLTAYKEIDDFICYKSNKALKSDNINIKLAERAATTGEMYNGRYWNWGTYPLEYTGRVKVDRKAVKGVNLETGEEKVFESAYSTIKEGFVPSSVSKCARGEMKSHLGYVWYYI